MSYGFYLTKLFISFISSTSNFLIYSLKVLMFSLLGVPYLRVLKKVTKKAFSIAEIIVTNTTILTLSTVSFIIMEGYIDGAKNVKVSYDLSNMLTKIEVVTLSGEKTLNELLVETPKISSHNNIEQTATINSGNAINSGNSHYKIGNINFVNLGEKQENFQDSQFRDYIFAYVVHQKFIKTELAGSVTDKNGNNASLVKGTYYQVSPSDSEGLITISGEQNFEIAENGKIQNLY